MGKLAQSAKPMRVLKFDIADLYEGMSVMYTTFLGRAEVDQFARLSGDVSPLHVNKEFGRKSVFGNNIVHGVLIASHFSTVVGVLLPGQNALLSGLNLDFVKPVPVDSEITISASVQKIQKASRMIVVKFLAFYQGEVCVEAAGRVKVMPPVA